MNWNAMSGKRVSELRARGICALASSWYWVRDDFADEFAGMRDGGVLAESGGELIWSTRHKFVIKADSGNGRTVVFKSFRKVRSLPYVFRLAPGGREAVNYLALENAGLPVARVLACGEERNFFRLSNCFLITELVKDSRDGLVFCPGGSCEAERGLRERFFAEAFRVLAGCHGAGFWHRGFTPANLLFCGTEDDFRIIMIDVASCRKVTRSKLRCCGAGDFAEFFRFFKLSIEEKKAACRSYFAALRGEPLWSCEELMQIVENELQNKKFAGVYR